MRLSRGNQGHGSEPYPPNLPLQNTIEIYFLLVFVLPLKLLSSPQPFLPVFSVSLQPRCSTSTSSLWHSYTAERLGVISSWTWEPMAPPPAFVRSIPPQPDSLTPTPALLPPSTSAVTIGLARLPRNLSSTWVGHRTTFAMDLRAVRYTQPSTPSTAARSALGHSSSILNPCFNLGGSSLRLRHLRQSVRLLHWLHLLRHHDVIFPHLFCIGSRLRHPGGGVLSVSLCLDIYLSSWTLMLKLFSSGVCR